MAYTSIDKANAIALTLEQQFQPNQVQDPEFNRDVIRRPIILYGCVDWGYASKTHINKLQTVQSKILRLIAGTDIRTRTDQQ
uniref:Uncharacterized protein n=1 Tax=Timema genevievae TaxID=629358 RepID=A0A7R9K023_TIMGE|nr:unnamed protein product [Timema genevievae]